MRNKYKWLQLIGLMFIGLYVLYPMGYASPSIFWITSYPGSILYLIGHTGDYLNTNRLEMD